MITMNAEPTYYPKEKANRIAEELRKADPEWQYKVIDFVDSGYSVIKVIDEEGNTVGYWN